jgi:hypothetical protein
VDGSTDLKGDTKLSTEPLSVRTGVLIQKLEDWKSYLLLQEIGICDLCDMYNADETGVFFVIQHMRTVAFCGDLCHDAIKSEW